MKNPLSAGESVGQALRFHKYDASQVLEEMRQRCLRIETEIQHMADDLERLERERNLLRYKVTLLQEKLERKEKAPCQ